MTRKITFLEEPEFKVAYVYSEEHYYQFKSLVVWDPRILGKGSSNTFFFFIFICYVSATIPISASVEIENNVCLFKRTQKQTTITAYCLSPKLNIAYHNLGL